MKVWQWFLAGVTVVLATVLIMVYGFGIEMFGLELSKHVQNKQTEVRRETNQYVTTQQQLLQTYVKEYYAAESDESTTQMKAIAAQIASVSATLADEYISEDIRLILAKEGY